jgi:hypothetical protein
MRSISVFSYNTLAQRYVDPYITTRYKFVPDPIILNWQFRLNLIRKKITDYNADVVCLQEVELSSIKEDFIDYLYNYGYDGYACHMIIKARINVIGNITFWKKSVLICAGHDTNSYGVFTMFDLAGTNDRPGNKILIVNIHLKAGLISGEKDRQFQMLSCMKKLFLDNIPSCICGDFNDDLRVNGPIHRILENNRFICYGNENTCHVYDYSLDKSNFHSFDHIVSLGYRIKMVKNEEQLVPIPNIFEGSDHYPIIFYILVE